MTSPPDDAEAQGYFTEAEWNGMVTIEKNRVTNMLRNYKCLQTQGINAKPPDFIARYENRKKEELKASQLSNSEESEASIGQSPGNNSNWDESRGQSSHDALQEGDSGESLSPDSILGLGYWGDTSSDFMEYFTDFCQYCYIFKHLQCEDSENKPPSFGDCFVNHKSEVHALKPSNDQAYTSCSCGCESPSKTRVLSPSDDQKTDPLKPSNAQSYNKCSCGCQSAFKTHLPLTGDCQTDLHCQECGQKFAKQKYLKNHIKRFSIPDENRPFKCSFCSHSFVHEKNRKFHERIHNDSKPIPCCHCSQSFADLTSARIHINEAHQNRVHMCNECGMNYSNSSHLRRHKREVRKAFPHQCYVCGHRYLTSVALKRHELLHSRVKPFKCRVCLKIFSSKTQLTKHSNAPNTEKKYECSSCKVQFLAHKSLKKHERIFNGDRPFKCTICGHAYNTKPRLTIHMKVHYREQQQQQQSMLRRRSYVNCFS